MLKRINWNLVFKSCAWVVCLGGMVVLMSFVNLKRYTVKCKDVKILIPGADNFIEREEVDAILKQSQGRLIGRNLEQINLHDIEDQMKANPYIALAKVYADMDGVINIEVNQRQPLLRIINANNQNFYVDNHGLKMPVSPNFTANVLVANGDIYEGFNGRVDTLKSAMAADLYKTAAFIKADTLWDAQIEQLYVNADHDIELIPRVGNQRIIIGNADSLETKMTNLLAFYKQAMPKVGWDTYKSINVKYTNQVICERSKADSLAVLHDSSLKKNKVPSVKKLVDSIIRNSTKEELNENVIPLVEDKPEVKRSRNSPQSESERQVSIAERDNKNKTFTKKNK
jgi:cell division protein FtsQ